MKFQYTEAAKERLNVLKSQYTESIERVIYDRKYIPGEEIVEVTASDLEQASEYLKVAPPPKNDRIKISSMIYGILGLILAVIGLFYPFFMEMIKESPERVILVIAGIAMISIGIWISRRIKSRE